MGDYEVVVVRRQQALAYPSEQVRFITCPSAASRGELLHAGAEAASGEILLFLWSDNRLPVEALLTIERNFSTLPQTIGGNFHVVFDKTNLATKFVARFIKHQRYHGRYYGNSGIFVRQEVYRALGGFKPYDILEDDDFGRRMEKFGPTLYLPDKIIASARRFGIRSALGWMLIIMFSKVKVHPHTLSRMSRFVGGK